MIREKLAHFLKNPESGDTTNAERQTARRLVNDWITGIYAGRRPSDTGGDFQLTLRMIREFPHNDLGGQHEQKAAYPRTVVWGRGVEAATRVPRIADKLRLALSDYRGLWGPAGDTTEILGVTEENGSDSPPLNPLVGEEWTHTYYFDWKISYIQAVTAA